MQLFLLLLAALAALVSTRNTHADGSCPPAALVHYAQPAISTPGTSAPTPTPVHSVWAATASTHPSFTAHTCTAFVEPTYAAYTNIITMTGRGKPGSSATPAAPTSSTPPSKPTGMSLAAALEKRMQSTSQRSTRVTHAHLPSTAGEHSLSGWVVTVLAGAANAAHPAIHAVGVQSDRVHILGDDGTIRAVSDRCNVVLNVISVVMADNSHRYHVPHHITITNLHGGVNQQFNPGSRRKSGDLTSFGGGTHCTSQHGSATPAAPTSSTPPSKPTGMSLAAALEKRMQSTSQRSTRVTHAHLPSTAGEHSLSGWVVTVLAGAANAAHPAIHAVGVQSDRVHILGDDGTIRAVSDRCNVVLNVISVVMADNSHRYHVPHHITITNLHGGVNQQFNPGSRRKSGDLTSFGGGTHCTSQHGSATPAAPTSSTPPSKPTGMSLAAALEKRMQSTSQRSTRVTHAHLPSTAGEHSLSGWVVTVLAGAANAAHPAIHAVGVQSDRVHILGDDGTIRAVSDRCNVVLNVISVVMADNSHRYHVPHHITITNLHGISELLGSARKYAIEKLWLLRRCIFCAAA
eukprot:XP_001700697.1 predicted protein [Chlamydomonas reinhardtii]